jgi:hypothetical protein
LLVGARENKPWNIHNVGQEEGFKRVSIPLWCHSTMAIVGRLFKPFQI